MRAYVSDFFTKNRTGTRAQTLRSTGFSVLNIVGQNGLRLASNLILTRLLFPEAFGLMALVYVFLTGLQMFSDLGINVSIMQNNRGLEPEFLNTAWTLQIVRGGVLWICCCFLAWPAAQLYGEPQLVWLLPVTGLVAVIDGFRTTKIAVANRQMMIGVQVMTGLSAQFAGLVLTVGLAWLWPGVWALVWGALFSSLLTNILQDRLLPGPSNRLHWDRPAMWSMINFGKFIFLSSIAGFLSLQGDRAVLGVYVSMAELGIYTVGFIMAMLPMQLIYAMATQVAFPLYRKYLDLADPENRRKLRRARRALIGGAVSITSLLALTGVPLINFLYDPRYTMAGPILVLMCFSIVLQIASALYEGAYLAHGNSQAHFWLNLWRAVMQTTVLLVGVSMFGMIGAIVAPGLGVLLLYPLRVRVLRRYHAWDPAADAAVVLAGTSVVALSCWLWREDIAAFLAWSM